MANKLLVVCLLIISSAVSAKELKQMSPMPSPDLIKLLKLNKNHVVITPNIQIKIGNNGSCENPWVVNLGAVAKLKNIVNIKVAIESKTKNKLLFEVKSPDSLTSNDSYFTTRVKLPEYRGEDHNVWVFMESNKSIFANSTKYKCNYVQ